METKTIQASGFARRLHEACDKHSHCPPLQKGRLIWVKEQLSQRGIQVSVESVRKWLEGEVEPRRPKRIELAGILDVNPVWLDMGERPRQPTGRSEANSAVSPSIPVAIRDGVVIQIGNVPYDLNAPEARKIANVILAYGGAVD